jgi:hypothetical protein
MLIIFSFRIIVVFVLFIALVVFSIVLVMFRRVERDGGAITDAGTALHLVIIVPWRAHIAWCTRRCSFLVGKDLVPFVVLILFVTNLS